MNTHISSSTHTGSTQRDPRPASPFTSNTAVQNINTNLNKTMRQINAILTGLLLVAAGLRVEAQTTGIHSFNNLNKAVPDGNSAGMSDTRSVASPVVNISAVRVKLRVAGEFNGDLYGYLRHITPQATNYVVLLNRVGRTTSDTAGYDDAGFDVTFAGNAAQDIHLYRDSATVPAGQPLTGTWQPDGRSADPGGVLDTSARATSLASFAGMDANGEWTLFLADMESGGTNMLVSWELEVTGAVAPGVSWEPPGSIVYGTGLGAGELDATSPVDGSFAYSPSAGTVLNAGSHTLTAVFTPTDLASYVRVTNTVAITVNPAPLTITAVDNSKVYGADLPAFTASYSGFVNGDNAAGLDSPVQLATAATAASDAGTYDITATGAADANYSITYVKGTLIVTQAPLTITADNKSKIYGAELPSFTASYSGFVNGDTPASLDTAVAFTTAATTASPVGTYAIAPTAAADKNYAVSFVNGTLTVTPAALTITAVDKSKVYGAALPELTADYSGFVNGDSAASLDTPPQLATTATTASPVGTYPITVSGAADANYTITHINGNLTVTHAALTITATSLNKVYGAPVPTLVASYVGFVNGDDEADLDPPVHLETTATQSSPAGQYPITASAAANPNYTVTFVAGTLTVTPASLTIAANNATKKYGAPLPAFTARYEGFVNGDNESSLTGTLSLATTATQTSDAGTYSISPSGLASPNYDITFQNGTLTIEKAGLTGIVSSSQNPALLGENVTFTHALTAVSPGAGTPTGAVEFRIDGSIAGSGTLAGSAAPFSTASLAHGTHTVVAEYAGDNNFHGVTNALSPDQFINRAPVAGADTIERYPTNCVKVSIASLLSNDTDADGDAITFVSVAGTSANGATVVRSGNWIFYTPAEGFTSADSFTYQIRDSRGATVTGAVNVAVKVDNAPAMNLTIADLGNRSYRLRFDGVPQRAYTIHFTDSMTPASWQPLTNITANGFGIFECTNTVPEGVTQRFYRSSYP